MTKKTVCFFNSNKVWGGGEKWHLQAALTLKGAGYDVCAVTQRDSELATRMRRNGIPVKRLSISNLSFLNILKIRNLRAWLADAGVDAVIVNLPADAKLGGIASAWAGVPKVIYRRGLAVPVRNSFLNRLVYRHLITHVIANALEIKRTILHNNPALVPDEKIHIIYNGVNLDNYTPDSAPPLYARAPGEILLGNAGRFVEQKAQKHLIEVARILKMKKVAFKLLIAGSGALENELKIQAQELGVTDKVIFTGFVDDMPRFLRTVDMFLLSSVHEGSANTVIEAMACKKPVVAFDISSNPELIQNNETGFLVPYPDVRAFAEKVALLMEQPELIKMMGQNGRRTVEKRFDIQKNIMKVIDLIEA